MPFPRSRLDVYWVFSEQAHASTLLERQLADWVDDELLTTDRGPGNDYVQIGCGYFNSVQVIASNKDLLFANHQGGYRVFCPNNDKIATLEFSEGVAEWRKSEQDPSVILVTCLACGDKHPLPQFVGRPAFAFGRSALHFNSVEKASFSNKILTEIRQSIGPFTIVLKRVG